MRTQVPALGVAALILAACAADSPAGPKGLFFPTVPRSEFYPAALIHGILEREAGCLFIRSGDERYLLMWPEGYSVQAADGGSLTVLDEDGSPIGAVGDGVELGGGGTGAGEVGGQQGADEWFLELTGEEPPESCRGGYWIVSP